LSTNNASRGTLHKYGTAVLNQVTDEAYSYISPIELNKNFDALLALLWRYRGRMDFYVINCLNILLEIIVENQFLSEYMFNLDPPTYEYARFTDWFRPYLEKELEKARRNMTYRHSTKKEEQIVKCFSFLEVYEAKLRKYEHKLQGLPEEEEKGFSTPVTQETAEPSDKPEEVREKKVGFEDEQMQNIRNILERDDDDFIRPPRELPVIEHYPKKYIVGCTRKIEEINREERDGIIVITQKVYVEYAESQPTLCGNKTLPSYAFYNSKIDAEEYDRKHQAFITQAEPSTRNDDSDEYGIRGNIENKESHGAHEIRQDAPHITVTRVGEETGAVSHATITKRNQEPEDLEEGNNQDPDEPREDSSDWNLPKQVGDVIIAVIVENTTTKGFNMKLKLVCDDDIARENIKAPVNEIGTYMKPQYYDLWLCVQKVFPEKDWGQFHLEWDAQEEIPEIRRGGNLGGYSNQRDDTDDYNEYTERIYGPTAMHMNFYSMV